MSPVAAAEAADNRPVAAGIPAMMRSPAAVSADSELAGAAASAVADSPATAGPDYDPGYSPDYPLFPPCESIAHINFYTGRVYHHQVS